MSDFDAILARLPSLQNLLDTYGSMSLFEYAKEHYNILPNESLLGVSRKREFLDFLDVYVTRKYGKKSAEIVIDALSRNYAVSTAEHHGPMGHPFFFQSALLRAIVQPALPVINFATSHVSLGNSSYPRGLVFHGDGPKAPKEYLYLPFFSSKLRMCPVFGLPAYTQLDIEDHCIRRLQKYQREHIVSEGMYENILEFIQQYVLNPGILALKTYSEQITHLNHIWWANIFPEMPAYISLDAEDVVVELLKKHLHEQTSFSRLLTDMDIQSGIEEVFDGILCCFERKTKKGTYLFWYLDEENKRHALWREGDELMSIDNNFRMKMTQEAYEYHLEQNHLIPSGLLVYTLFVCYYGVTCFGGFAQGEYLSRIQDAFEKVAIAGENLSTQSSILNEDMVFIYPKNGEISTTLDLHIQNKNLADVPAVQKVILKDSIYKMQYEISRCF